MQRETQPWPSSGETRSPDVPSTKRKACGWKRSGRSGHRCAGRRARLEKALHHELNQTTGRKSNGRSDAVRADLGFFSLACRFQKRNKAGLLKWRSPVSAWVIDGLALQRRTCNPSATDPYQDGFQTTLPASNNSVLAGTNLNRRVRIQPIKIDKSLSLRPSAIPAPPPSAPTRL